METFQSETAATSIDRTQPIDKSPEAEVTKGAVGSAHEKLSEQPLSMPTLAELTDALARFRPGRVVDGVAEVLSPDKFRKILDTTETVWKELIDPLSSKGVRDEKQDWVVAWDLTTNFGDGWGVEDRLAVLRSLAAKTKGKDITIVAQAAVRNPGIDDADDCDDADSTASKSYHIDRYVVRNGLIRKIDSNPSQGYGKDLENLLGFTTSRFSSDKYALLIDSHGHGNSGLGGDTGRITLADAVTAIRNGMKPAERKKLDLIDFDCCQMGQQGVIRVMRHVAKHIVASEENEGDAGQDIKKPLQVLISNPKISAEQLGKAMVEAGRKQGEPDPDDSWFSLMFERERPKSVRTIAHFDTSKFREFRHSLDNFGEQLCASMHNNTNRDAIENVIVTAPDFGGDPDFEMYGPRKDLKCFTDGVIKAVDNGKISDSNGCLRRAAQDCLAKQRSLIESEFTLKNYARCGGLSAFLPDRYLTDIDAIARYATSPFRMHELTKRAYDLPTQKDKDAAIKSMDACMDKMWKELHDAEFMKKVDRRNSHDVRDKLHDLEAAVDDFHFAKTLDDEDDALDKVLDAAVRLEQSHFYQDKLEQQRESARKTRDKQYKAQLVDPGTGWGKFRDMLRTTRDLLASNPI